VYAIVHGDAEQIAAALGKGEAEERRGLDVGDGVGAGVGLREDGAGAARGEGLGGKYEDGTPGGRRRDMGNVDGATLVGGGNESTKPAGGGVVGMSFEGAGFFEDLIGSPV
jgi:hypothetical protein